MCLSQRTLQRVLTAACTHAAGFAYLQHACYIVPQLFEALIAVPTPNVPFALMSSTPLDELRQRKRAAAEELRDIDHSLRLARRREAASRVAQERAWVLRGSL